MPIDPNELARATGDFATDTFSMERLVKLMGPENSKAMMGRAFAEQKAAHAEAKADPTNDDKLSRMVLAKAAVYGLKTITMAMLTRKPMNGEN